MDTRTPDHGPAEGLPEELKDDARTLGDTAKTRAFDEADQRKGEAARQAKSVASALDTAAGELQDSPQWLQSAFRSGARTLTQLADEVETRDARDLGHKVTRLAREHPAAFLGVSALLGFAAARVLKAGASHSSAEPGRERMTGEAAMPITVEPGTDMSSYPTEGGAAGDTGSGYRGGGGNTGGREGGGDPVRTQGSWS